MRTLARLGCGGCGKRYFGDLPTGHGLGFPALLDADSGAVHHKGTLVVFAEHLARSYRERSDEPIGVEVESFRPLRLPILLNCLDWLYGHALLKLLNAQYHIDQQPEFDLVVLVPRFLRWLVPQGAAEVWTVDLPLSRGWAWNEGLASAIAERLDQTPEWWLSPAFPHPRAADFTLERFSGVRPFPLAEWKKRAAEMPTFTYVWRGDRDWAPHPGSSALARTWARVDRRLGRDVTRRAERVTEFAEKLRSHLGEIDFAVAGLDRSGTFPDWVHDLRDERPSPAVERSWCERFAKSHLAVGVHGSNMLLPSGHAGGVIEFVPSPPWDSRWGNIIQDILVRGDDPRDTMFRYRFLPADIEPDEAARVAVSLIHNRPSSWLLFDPIYSDHEGIGRFWRTLPEAFRDAEP